MEKIKKEEPKAAEQVHRVSKKQKKHDGKTIENRGI